MNDEQRQYNIAMAQSNTASFMAVRAARLMGIDWRHVETLAMMLAAREGRTLGDRPAEDELFDHANECAASILGACESPIEELFVAAICSAYHTDIARINLALRERWESKIFWWERYAGEPLVTLYQQFPVGRYRCDFMLDGPEKRVAIELDGHDFHERTKEQAARDKSRDRDLVEAGYVVLRFTGSEVWNGSEACADQAMRIAGLS